MELSDMDDAMLRAAIEASLRDAQTSDEQAHGTQSATAEASSYTAQNQVVDLTHDSDNNSDIQEVFPKSKSFVGSDTDESDAPTNEAVERRVHEADTIKNAGEGSMERARQDDEAAEEDEELRLAIAMSMEGLNHHGDPESPTLAENATQKSTEKPTEKPTGNPQQPQGVLGMDRKHMEQERLARQAKRKAGDSFSKNIGLEKDQANESASLIHQPPPKLRKTNPIRSSESGDPSPFSRSSSRAVPGPDICDRPDTNHPGCKAKPVARPVPQFPLGAVKKTSISNAPRSNDDITIEEVLQRGDLELAVLSSFLWDMEWLFTKMDTVSTRFILMMHAKEKRMVSEDPVPLHNMLWPRDSDIPPHFKQIQYQEETASMTNLRLCFPPMDGNINCMHSKLMLLFHPGYLRIAIPTANLTATDWGENNLMENTVFLIDLPKKGTQPGFCEDSKTPFYEELVYFLKATTLNEKIIQKMDNFDFSKTARYAFVHTIGGPHNDESAWRRTGYPGLGRAVTNLGLRTTAPVNLEYVTSSIGSLNDNFVRAIHYACKGDDGLTEYILRNDKNPFMAQTDDPNRSLMLKAPAEWKKRLRVYFPSDLTVRAAHSHPEETAGTICFQKKWYNDNHFPRDILRDCESERGVLMHNKLMFIWPQQAVILRDSTKCTAWVYVGSANFSESAWGRLVKDRATKEPRLNCRNWECGVIVPITSPYNPADDTPHVDTTGMEGREQLTVIREREKSAQEKEKFPVADINSFVPVPMKMPAKTYDEKPGVSQSGLPLRPDGSPHTEYISQRREKREPWFFMG
ncbi:tyrosyl-DNA phosphodiesterase-domain-containing protein [Penicillium cinerascens]|uniref:Tyrosyl-DNA phosphodiesterase-domain-containing protein n=1 Tax=Penicillium cinerascens TaxID=70096 RepID=A0A9W9MMC7_9EURO|nr:tyrosyl-DNA phosphodiesterase-domain-containing protein [Penicillium cinerascens]KAJ5203938.1 tyrosyl-DNA phosphodiesterase-domain-containing protein [Penicillium cinerascens]